MPARFLNFQKTTAHHEKKFLPCLDHLSYLLSENCIFSVTAQVPRHSFFLKKKNFAPSTERSLDTYHRLNNKKLLTPKKQPHMVGWLKRIVASTAACWPSPPVPLDGVCWQGHGATSPMTSAIWVERGGVYNPTIYHGDLCGKNLHQKRPCNDQLPLSVGRQRPFSSTAHVDRVMGDLAYDLRLCRPKNVLVEINFGWEILTRSGL